MSDSKCYWPYCRKPPSIQVYGKPFCDKHQGEDTWKLHELLGVREDGCLCATCKPPEIGPEDEASREARERRP